MKNNIIMMLCLSIFAICACMSLLGAGGLGYYYIKDYIPYYWCKFTDTREYIDLDEGQGPDCGPDPNGPLLPPGEYCRLHSECSTGGCHDTSSFWTDAVMVNFFAFRWVAESTFLEPGDTTIGEKTCQHRSCEDDPNCRIVEPTGDPPDALDATYGGFESGLSLGSIR